MFTADSRHKGLATFRAHRERKKQVAIAAKQVAESNPSFTEAQCKAMAEEIINARERAAAERTIKVQKRGKGKGRKNQSKRRRRGPAFNTIPVQTVNTIKK